MRASTRTRKRRNLERRVSYNEGNVVHLLHSQFREDPEEEQEEEEEKKDNRLLRIRSRTRLRTRYETQTFVSSLSHHFVATSKLA
jgi:hypothetical protein